MKRFTAFICALVILIASVPAFAVDFDSVFTADNYGGSIRSNSFAMDALESLQEFLDATFPLNSPALFIVDTSNGYVSFYSPEPTYTDPYYIYLQSNGYLSFRTGIEFSSSASNISSHRYFTYIDVDQYANGVFVPSGNWIDSGSTLAPLSQLNSVAVWYGNPANNIYNVDGTIIDWPWTGGGAPIQYQIPLSPGNMIVIQDTSGIDLSSIRITASGLPASSGSASPQWFTGIRIGNPTTIGQLFSSNGADTYNSTGTNAFWDKAAFSSGLDGISTSGIITLTPDDYSNNTLFIYNPIGITTNSGNVYNPTIYITMDEAPPEDTQIYPAYISDGVTTFPRGGDPMYNDTVRPIVAVGFNSAREIYYYDSNRPTIAPDIANVPGGYNAVVSPSDPVESTVNGILGILQSGARAVQSLITGAQEFFQSLRQMYTWLPDEVYSLLMSCLFLVFVIGVIKVLH